MSLCEVEAITVWAVYSKHAKVTVNSMVIYGCLKVLQRKPLKYGRQRVCVLFHPLKRHFSYITNTPTQWESRSVPGFNPIKKYSISRTRALEMTSSCVMCQSEPLKSCSFSRLSSPESLKYNNHHFFFGFHVWRCFLWIFCWLSFSYWEGSSFGSRSQC